MSVEHPRSGVVRVDWKCNLTYNIVVYASVGEISIHFEDEVVHLPAGQALWIPTRLAHMVEHDEKSLGISILIPQRAEHTLGVERRIIAVPNSHRQWMFHLMLLTLSPLHTGQVATDQVIQLLTRFAAVPATHSNAGQLKIPRHSAARRTAISLMSDPHSSLRLVDFAARYGVSERTIGRAFSAESGMSFSKFRQACGSLSAASPALMHPVPALSTRWMNLLRNDVVLWAMRGRAVIHVAAHAAPSIAERTQRLQAGQLMLIPCGHSVRLEIEQGSLLFPLPLPSGALPSDALGLLPCQLPASHTLALLRRSIAHITALRPLYFDPLDTLTLLEKIPNYPGLRFPTSPLLRRIASALMADLPGNLSADEVSRTHGISLRQLQRRWPEETGLRLQQWRQRHRFQHAQSLLAAGFSVNFTATQLGFSESSNFSRAFMKIYGYRPRKIHLDGESDIYGSLNDII
ncbi:helix-turn-helix domain-containing protein [Glutamicibacter uratoxydans]|uniref:helix-turn-helix domain-containing protein n=1 Tax=Glutamicibacter uratoxydans TaxID=43667 RepID=UPI0011440F44|nr:helix-turn-helix domain-containing protein [Glutamicibacter uratoxydans]